MIFLFLKSLRNICKALNLNTKMNIGSNWARIRTKQCRKFFWNVSSNRKKRPLKIWIQHIWLPRTHWHWGFVAYVNKSLKIRNTVPLRHLNRQVYVDTYSSHAYLTILKYCCNNKKSFWLNLYLEYIYSLTSEQCLLFQT